jgi:large subunit ribosomal protein L1
MNLDKNLLKQALEEALNGSILKKDGKPDKKRKFNESVDLIINIRDVDIKNPNNRIEQEHILPHPVTDKPNICFFTEGDMELAVKKLGVPVINNEGLEELNKRPNKEKRAVARKYDYFIARADLMRNVAKVMARFLGQRGKMPKPQPKGFGVVTPNENLADYMEKMKALVKVEMKKQLQILTKIGHRSLSVDDLMDNLNSVVGLVESKLPNGTQNIRSIFIKTTMGKVVKVKEPESKRK